MAVRQKGRLKNRDDADPETILNVVAKRLDTGEIHYFILLANEWAGTQYYLDKIPDSKIYSRSDSSPHFERD